MQLSFDFPFQDQYFIEDFVVSKRNQGAFKFVKNYNPSDGNSPRIFVVVAPQLGGKTYLANIWQKKVRAEFLDLKKLSSINLVGFIKVRGFYIVEDVDKIKSCELLLQIFNVIQEKSAFLFLTSSVDLSRVGLKIKDLNSRLKNIFQLKIDNPDDCLIEMLLVKSFANKQLRVGDKVINFLVKNLNRSFVAIFDVVRLLEFYSLEKRQNITIPLVKEVLKIYSRKSSN